MIKKKFRKIRKAVLAIPVTDVATQETLQSIVTDLDDFHPPTH